MQRQPYTYNLFKKAATVFLIAMLAWLTVSTPFIMSMQQNCSTEDISASWPCSDTDEDCTDCSGNGAEEKAPNGSNLSEEFLHEHHYPYNCIVINARNHRQENMDVYIAFHGELHAPPPNAA
jgi:hypothetical protein